MDHGLPGYLCLTDLLDQDLSAYEFFQTLSPEEQSSLRRYDSEIAIGAKDGYQSLWGNWVIELAELSSSTRKEVETVKSYISQQKDVFRPSYGRLLQEFPRTGYTIFIKILANPPKNGYN